MYELYNRIFIEILLLNICEYSYITIIHVFRVVANTNVLDY